MTTGSDVSAERSSGGRSREEERPSAPPSRPALRFTFPIVGVGASSGGLEALSQLLGHLPAETGMALVVVQHLDPTRKSMLRDALAKCTTMPVSDVEQGMAVASNHVYVIPSEFDIAVSAAQFSLVRRKPSGSGPHLPIDDFFRSLAVERGSQAIGVVLSGNASDGSEGLRAIKAEGGITFAQDPASAKYPEMPRHALDAGVVDYAVSIAELADELVRLSGHPYFAAAEMPQASGDGAALSEILNALHGALGVDFAEYKQPTLRRRLGRRMALRRSKSVADYLELVLREPAEMQALSEDLLIHVTSFFRDREVFEALQANVLPEIIRAKPDAAGLRFWVAGCSSGEEVYSLAICLVELLGNTSRPVQIFATDVSEATIATARAGVYPHAALSDVSEERRRRFFVKAEHTYQICKAVRDLCVFVRHDLARDPPFAKLDLLSCRNVLIYFGTELQKRVLPSFHYALNQPGYLLLGRAESVSGFGQLFLPFDKSVKIFARAAGASPLRFAPRHESKPVALSAPNHEHAAPSPANDVAKHLDRMLLARYAPPGVLINSKMDVLQYRGDTGPYLRPARGEPQNNLFGMARHGLLAALRGIIQEAATSLAPVTRSGVEIDHEGAARTCNLVVFPLLGMPAGGEPLYVVIFEDCKAPQGQGAVEVDSRRRAAQPEPSRRLRQVEHELVSTREYLQSLVEDHGRAVDALSVANEELVSSNEELQSMNEELETAKEELQSINEELTTVNEELRASNQDVTESNSDLVNLLETVDIPIIILDRKRRIRRLTPKARSILNVLPSDLGRSIDDIKPNVDALDLDAQIAEVIRSVVIRESEVRDRDGRWYRMQIRPYKASNGEVDGAIVSLVDIDSLKHHVAEAQLARTEAEQANQAKDVFLAVLSHELRTPLTGLLLNAQLLGRAAPSDAAKLAQIGAGIERGVRVQTQLVDDLLDVSRIVAGKLSVQMSPVDLRAIVATAVEGVAVEAAKKKIRMESSLSSPVVQVSGDAVRLHQVVTNLLTNAIKFTPQGGAVTVALDASAADVALRVTDSGAGIVPEFLPYVFDRFAQQDSSNTRNHGGLGLGLAIVRYLVEQHGGTVHASSEGVGAGATFVVKLPVVMGRSAGVVAALAETNRRAEGLAPLVDVRVLVVDDHTPTLEAIGALLGARGAQIQLANSTLAAMALVQAFKPVVILCDIVLPDEDGYAFLRKLRALEESEGGAIPAIALTALATMEDEHHALAAGFQMHLTKPVDSDVLCDAVALVRQRGTSMSSTETSGRILAPHARTSQRSI